MNSGNKSKQAQRKPMNLKAVLEKLKSDYILQKILEYMKKNISLGIIKYNKGLQKRLNLNLKDYKNYSLLIELELKLDNYGKFINIPEGQKRYFHIYFDNSNVEAKRDRLKENENVKIINIKIDKQVKSFTRLFCFCQNITSINFKKFSRTDITNMGCMFQGCISLEELNLSKFNTENVTNMAYMFDECSSLEKLDLSNFNTNNVTNMSCMFNKCSSLKELELSSFNTDNVTDMYKMFSKCSKLKKINLSNFNTQNVSSMNRMFNKCLLLKELDISHFNIDNVEDMSFMFKGCNDDLKKKVKEQNQNINIDDD